MKRFTLDQMPNYTKNICEYLNTLIIGKTKSTIFSIQLLSKTIYRGKWYKIATCILYKAPNKIAPILHTQKITL